MNQYNKMRELFKKYQPKKQILRYNQTKEITKMKNIIHEKVNGRHHLFDTS